MANLKVVPSEAQPPAGDLDSLARGDLGSKLRIERVLTQRAGTLTYLAREARRRRSVVLRVVDRRLLEARGALDALQARLSELAAIEHPGIVPLYDFGLGEHSVWWTTQFVDAPSLADIVRREGGLRLERVLRVAKPVADALLHAHHHGLAHGGLTPDRVLIRADDWAVITDFVRPGEWLPGPVDAEPTVPSPGGDQRALATTMYRCLVGEVDPAAASQPPELASVTVLAACQPNFPPALRFALVRGADPDPQRQFGSVVDLVTALNPGPPPTAAPDRPPMPEILVPEANPAGPVSTHSERRLLAIAALVLLAFAGLWFGLTQLLTSPSDSGELAAAGSPPSAATPAASAAPATAPAPAPAPAPRSTAPAPPSPVNRHPAAVRTKPVAVTPPPAKRKPAPPPHKPEPPSQPAAESARLLVRSVPGGTLYIDDRLIGPATEMAIPISPGRHTVKVTKPGYRRYLAMVDLAAGEERRLTDVVLEPQR